MKKPDAERLRSDAVYKEVFSSLSPETLALIGCHLYAEREIEHALEILLIDATPVLAADFSFSTKLKILSSIWPEMAGFKKMDEILSCLNKARNAASHGASTAKTQDILRKLFSLFKDHTLPDSSVTRLHYIGGYISGYLSTTSARNKLQIKIRAASLPRKATLLKQLSQAREEN